jgi:selenocysteine lyase/cysteine desulfurase
MRRVLCTANPGRSNLLAFPAQSNFSGVQHPLDLVAFAQDLGWDVLLDTAAFAPTNRLDLSQVRPDFACVSFYKMMGYPTGAGCLLVRRDAARALVRPWFAGGTVTVASVQADGHHLHDGAAAFEDGTVDYTNLPAVEIGLRHLQHMGIDQIHARVMALTGWLLEALAGLRHADGRPVVDILGPGDTTDRGGTVTLEVLDRDGRAVAIDAVEELAARANISLRTGCFCNPGAGEVAHHLGARELRPWFDRDRTVTFDELRDGLRRDHDVRVGAIRVSLGASSNFGDVYRFVNFLQGFVDRTSADIERSRAR